ncbi:MAG: hypothetical protein KDA85_19550 [Planctomycetaceae bacterium]|nr:hypothetical protein [Planctomycetaceae bacterium]
MLASVVSASASERQVKVPPSDELLIIDPKMDPQRRPTPEFVEDEFGNQRIEIPPTVIVHRYYYTGNREFQGPMLPGGPTVIVINSPHSGEQISLNVNLLPGAPRVIYRRNSIRYDYGDRYIDVDFGLADSCTPEVHYGQKSELLRSVREEAKSFQATNRAVVQQTGFRSSMSKLKEHTKKSFMSAAGYMNQMGSGVVTQTGQFMDSLWVPPGVNPDPAPARGIVDGLEATAETVR